MPVIPTPNSDRAGCSGDHPHFGLSPRAGGPVDRCTHTVIEVKSEAEVGAFVEKLPPAHSQAKLLGAGAACVGQEPIGPQEGFLLEIGAVSAATGWGYPKGGHCEGEDVWHMPPPESAGGGVFKEARRMPVREVAANLSSGQRASPRLAVSCLCPDFSLGTPPSPPPPAKCQQLWPEGGRPSLLGPLQVPAQLLRRGMGHLH